VIRGTHQSPWHWISFPFNLPEVQDVAFQGTDPGPILNTLCNRKPTDKLHWPDLFAITVVAARRATVMHKKLTWGDWMKYIILLHLFNVGV
jgi:hypothetical protein